MTIHKFMLSIAVVTCVVNRWQIWATATPVLGGTHEEQTHAHKHSTGIDKGPFFKQEPFRILQQLYGIPDRLILTEKDLPGRGNQVAGAPSVNGPKRNFKNSPIIRLKLKFLTNFKPIGVRINPPVFDKKNKEN